MNQTEILSVTEGSVKWFRKFRKCLTISYKFKCTPVLTEQLHS